MVQGLNPDDPCVLLGAGYPDEEDTRRLPDDDEDEPDEDEGVAGDSAGVQRPAS